jgi:hypothetical protein
MAPPRKDGEGRCPQQQRPYASHVKRERHPQRRQRSATPTVTSSITKRISLLQDGTAAVAQTAADVARSADDRAWAEAATHLDRATWALWMAAEALADWEIAS